MTERIVLASSNRDKIKEIQAMLTTQIIVPQSDFKVPEAMETGTTFIENAIIKARNACRHSGMAAIADDSGIEVDALGGCPGVISARYAGEGATDLDNLEKLLTELTNIPDNKRGARFRCLMVYMRHHGDPSPIFAEGVWEGTILRAPAGENGFGYDPIFLVPERGCSSAQLEPEVKNRLSHRGKALQQLMGRLLN